MPNSFNINVTKLEFHDQGGEFPFYWEVECGDYVNSNYESNEFDRDKSIKNAVMEVLNS
tara:strand:- start:1525 stop:1701 length:177 start_codon:yes stop_codon:yes gene_type:complete